MARYAVIVREFFVEDVELLSRDTPIFAGTYAECEKAYRSYRPMAEDAEIGIGERNVNGGWTWLEWKYPR
jgi:hypothetical protein